MRVLIALCLVLVCGTQAFPSFQRSAAAARGSSGSSGSSSLPPFVPAGPGDLRSPCPILNTLANHGILPHNGRDITEQKLSSAFIKFLGTTKAFGEGFAKIAFAKFIKYKKTVDPAATTITLGDLALPFEKDGIAHNASLSRPDAPTTVDPQHYVVPKPDAARVDSELAKVNKRGKDILTMADLSAIRKFVKTLSAPKAAPLVHEFIGAAEICLLMNAGYGKTGLTADWYRTFLVEEKFPADFHISERLMGFGFINVGRCVLGIEARTAYLTIKDQIRKIPYFGVPHQ